MASTKVLMLLGIAFLASVCVSSRPDQEENPFFFRSNNFQTVYENENGRIRLLQKFDKRSNLLENLQNYRLLEYNSKPQTLFLPRHSDADFILVVLRGKAILNVVNNNQTKSFNLERGDTINLPAGAITSLANRDDNEDLRVLDLVIPINKPGQFELFPLTGSQSQESYIQGFSKRILEASYNANYEEIESVLLEEQEQKPQHRRDLRNRKQKQSQSQEQDVIVKITKEQIEELSRNAKSSSRRSVSAESGPVNLRSRNIYSNKFGNFYEITPEKNPQLQDLDILINSVDIREGSLLLPHFNSRVIVIVTVNEGNGNLELIGQRNENQQEQREEEREEEEEEEERSQQVQRYKARLSPGDVFIIPAGYPVAISASSNLNLLGFGINAENNQRNFLAGEEDNVISQIQRPVQEIAFPGSAQEIEKLLKNQKQSYFANAQKEEGSKRIRDLASILGAF